MTIPPNEPTVEAPLSMARVGVVAVVMLVGLWDLTTGLYMLLSPEPWRAHGPGTLWVEAGAALPSTVVGTAVMSMLRRIGAFSLYAGALSLGLGWYAPRPPHADRAARHLHRGGPCLLPDRSD